jgi:hypothetical protein
MSMERLEDAAARLNLPGDVLADHLWEQGVPALNGDAELTPEMVVVAEAFASRFAPPPVVEDPPSALAPAVEAEAPTEATDLCEDPEEVRLGSGVRRRRRRNEGDG